MDPADQDAVHHRLETRGRLLGQHDHLLTDIWASLQTLKASVTDLLTPGWAEQVPSPPPAEAPRVVPQPAAAAPQDPRVPTPERYSGEAGMCASFLLQCSIVFNLQPVTYPSNRAKIAFVLNLLSGTAEQWATAVLENQTPASSSVTAELKWVFDHLVQRGEAASQILSLRQGSSSVVDYSIQFRILASGTMHSPRDYPRNSRMSCPLERSLGTWTRLSAWRSGWTTDCGRGASRGIGSSQGGVPTGCLLQPFLLVINHHQA
ncbi:hypothetical protein D4764_01G0019640 [Takifugu flavidus]|uniref:DUF4939 domain-containing protein n=1 Tax=Takifugu flavidus TaxID=433684 RepID=A0A5C6PT76_9TELE|nr:hypothetical protein D4764_01G0019640 [Takifugu flavidus]